MRKRKLLTSKIPVLRIHTIKTPLIVQISISTFFSGSQKPYYERISKKNPAEQKYSKNGAAGKCFGTSYFDPALSIF
jgi:hypothetical protein